MGQALRFAIVSDLHVGLPETIWDHPERFHLIEVSIPALEQILEHLSQQALDFLLLPGDLTQHGERANHAWLVERLRQLPFPVYVVPGNHDVPLPQGDSVRIGLEEFATYYREFGYGSAPALCYRQQLAPGIQLIGLNSNCFDGEEQRGLLDPDQLAWLRQELAVCGKNLVLVMIHHNVLEHVPDQACHPLGRRYMLENAAELLSVLNEFGVQILFTGHLHVQNIARRGELHEITTGSLVSYPHPYRVLELQSTATGWQLVIESHRIKTLPQFENLQHFSREWMGDRSRPFMLRLLTLPPLSLSLEEAEALVPSLRYFWAKIADGDPQFSFPDFPERIRHHMERYSDGDRRDNHAVLHLTQPLRVTAGQLPTSL
jgi:3',5'-cyclic AMP phosphodiesterase CpdA